MARKQKFEGGTKNRIIDVGGQMFLENGFDGSIQEVAAEVGYDDVYHFSKLFKKRFGMPPSKIRKLL